MKLNLFLIVTEQTVEAFFPGMRTHELKQLNANIRKVAERRATAAPPTYKKDGLTDDRKRVNMCGTYYVP